MYLLATDKSKKEDKVMVAILLNLIGPEGLEIYNNFNLTDSQKDVYKTVIEEFE